MSDLYQLSVSVNDTEYQREVDPRLLLSDFIRQELGHGASVQQAVDPFLFGHAAAPVEAEAGSGDPVLEPGLEGRVEDGPAVRSQGRCEHKIVWQQVVFRVYIGFRQAGKGVIARTSLGGPEEIAADKACEIAVLDLGGGDLHPCA